MIGVECMDPFDDCELDQVNQGAQQCRESITAKCAAECSIQVGNAGPTTLESMCYEAFGDCELATQCAELVTAVIEQGTYAGGCNTSNCVRNGGTSCFVEESGGARTL
jgi:hypothetical protein